MGGRGGLGVLYIWVITFGVQIPPNPLKIFYEQPLTNTKGFFCLQDLPFIPTQILEWYLGYHTVIDINKENNTKTKKMADGFPHIES